MNGKKYAVIFSLFPLCLLCTIVIYCFVNNSIVNYHFRTFEFNYSMYKHAIGLGFAFFIALYFAIKWNAFHILHTIWMYILLMFLQHQFMKYDFYRNLDVITSKKVKIENIIVQSDIEKERKTIYVVNHNSQKDSIYFVQYTDDYRLLSQKECSKLSVYKSRIQDTYYHLVR